MPLTLEIITPDGIAWQGRDVDAVVLPTRCGEIEILPGHIPLITILNAGAVGVIRKGVETDLAVDIGYVRCSGDVVSVLTEAAIEVSNLDKNDIEKAKEEALKAVAEAKKNRLDDDEIERLEAMARFSMAKLLAKARKR